MNFLLRQGVVGDGDWSKRLNIRIFTHVGQRGGDILFRDGATYIVVCARVAKLAKLRLAGSIE